MNEPTDAQRIGLGIMHDLGLDWMRHDAFDRLVVVLGWLQHDGNPVAIADALRGIATMLDTDPVDYLQAALRRIEADARRALEMAA